MRAVHGEVQLIPEKPSAFDLWFRLVMQPWLVGCREMSV
jgi:hypothetical protein